MWDPVYRPGMAQYGPCIRPGMAQYGPVLDWLWPVIGLRLVMAGYWSQTGYGRVLTDMTGYGRVLTDMTGQGL